MLVPVRVFWVACEDGFLGEIGFVLQKGVCELVFLFCQANARAAILVFVNEDDAGALKYATILMSLLPA